MAFPTIQTADTQTSTVTSNSTSWTLTYPTNLASGDLILALVATDGTTLSPTWPSGWADQHRAEAGGAVTLHCAAKISAGTETGTFTFTPGASEQGAWRIFRITGWYGSGIWADGGAGTNNSTAEAAGVGYASATGTTQNPDPPGENPTNWITEDTLWIAACGVDTSRTISVYPLADLNTADVSGGAGGATLGICTTNSAVASLDPSTFTISASDDWAAATIAIRPASGTTYTKAGVAVVE